MYLLLILLLLFMLPTFFRKNKHITYLYLHFEYRWGGGDAVPMPDSGSSDRPGGVIEDSVEDPQLM